MAISQADFYAFSQATGSQVPEDPEGRAALAPYVMEWRRNQLKQPRQEEEGPNLIQTAGGLAAAAGVGTLAFLGGRRLGAAIANRRGVQPVNVQVQEEVVRRAAQPVPQLRGATGATPGAGTARPPIPRQPAPSSGPSAGPTRQVEPNPWDLPGTKAAVRDISEAAEQSSYSPRALPPAEPEYTAYRPDPKDMVSAAVADARRRAATAGLVEASRRTGSYQPEIPGVKGTLMALRSPAGQLAEETGELVAQAESRPLSAAPAQLNLMSYVKEAAEPQGDAVDRLLTEYNQLVESQARSDRRAQASVRQYQMEVQGKAMRVLDDLRSESLVENQQAKSAFNVDQAINALDSGEDQMTGRVRQQLQRNEDTDLSLVDRAEDLTGNIDVAASMTPDGVPVDQAEGGGRIDQLVQQGQRYLRAQEIDTDYDYSRESARQTAQVNQRVARALELKNTAERILEEEIGGPSPVEVARSASAGERQRLAAQGFAGERLEQQLMENMRSNFPEGREVMAPLQEETRRIERVGMPSALSVRENIGSLEPIRQGEIERVSKPASQQAGYEGGIRGMGRITREDIEEAGGGMGVYGLEPKYASGAVRKAGEFGESEYGELGYEYSPVAERRPTMTSSEARGKVALEDLRDPYSKLSTEQLGEMTLYGTDTDKYNAEQQLKKRASAEVSTRLRTLQLANRPGEAESFLARFKEGRI
jgi:hypothetical protein